MCSLRVDTHNSLIAHEYEILAKLRAMLHITPPITVDPVIVWGSVGRKTSTRPWMQETANTDGKNRTPHKHATRKIPPLTENAARCVYNLSSVWGRQFFSHMHQTLPYHLSDDASQILWFISRATTTNFLSNSTASFPVDYTDSRDVLLKSEAHNNINSLDELNMVLVSSSRLLWTPHYIWEKINWPESRGKKKCEIQMNKERWRRWREKKKKKKK